jgi:hypothetical protein
MKIFPHEEVRLNNIKYIRFLVPKFHLLSHVEACNLAFSFNLTKGVGRTDGEAPERGWANINPAAQSTKEMGPGTRRDTLDDHFGDWNWKKIIKLGKIFVSRHTTAAQPVFCLIRVYTHDKDPRCGTHAQRPNFGAPRFRSNNPCRVDYQMAFSSRVVGAAPNCAQSFQDGNTT